jgi:hypothetical protein
MKEQLEKKDSDLINLCKDKVVCLIGSSKSKDAISAGKTMDKQISGLQNYINNIFPKKVLEKIKIIGLKRSLHPPLMPRGRYIKGQIGEFRFDFERIFNNIGPGSVILITSYRNLFRSDDIFTQQAFLVFLENNPEIGFSIVRLPNSLRVTESTIKTLIVQNTKKVDKQRLYEEKYRKAIAKGIVSLRAEGRGKKVF